MPWKTTDDGSMVLGEDKNPVFIFQNGESKGVDPEKLHGEIGISATALEELATKYAKLTDGYKSLSTELNIELKDGQDSDSIILNAIKGVKSEKNDLELKLEKSVKKTGEERFSQEEFNAALELKTSEIKSENDLSSSESANKILHLEKSLSELKHSVRETSRLNFFETLYKELPESIKGDQANQGALFFAQEMIKELPDNSFWQAGPMGRDGKATILLHNSDGIVKNADGSPVVTWESFLGQIRKDKSMLFGKPTETDGILSTGKSEQDIRTNRPDRNAIKKSFDQKMDKFAESKKISPPVEIVVPN